MKLHQLFSSFQLENLPLEHQMLLDREVFGIYFDARLVKPNSVFVAIKGTEKDGHQFVDDAVKNGAIAVVAEKKSTLNSQQAFSVVVPNTRLALDHLASQFYGFPSQDLICVGVTGTNGKTSITFILEHILNLNQKKTGVIGTVNQRVGAKIFPVVAQNTTPDSVTLQHRLREFIEEGALCAALEVTSHALDQKRVDSVHFNTVIFTNLTLDHLDYHKTMESYFQTKERLFTDLMETSVKHPKVAIVNVDDPYGRRLQVANDVLAWTYGKTESDFQYKILKMNFAETEFEIKTASETFRAKLPVSGEHTIANVVASCAAALTCGVTIEQSLLALQSFAGVPGRLEKVQSSSKKLVFVDYAHSPDALERVLQALNDVKKTSHLQSQIITVFGCGGDRDKSKRPLMGKIAAGASQFIFITSDNPRTEDPAHILKDVQSGLPSGYSDFVVEIDREKAIAMAIEKANDGDVILIAGKGHEDYQIIGTEKKHFSDVEVASRYL